MLILNFAYHMKYFLCLTLHSALHDARVGAFMSLILNHAYEKRCLVFISALNC